MRQAQGQPFALALLEAFAVCLASILALLALDAQMTPMSFSSGLFFTSLLYPLWAALRVRAPQASRSRTALVELLRAVALCILVPLGVYLILRLAHLLPVLDRNTTGAGNGTALFMLALFGPVFLLYRALIYAWAAWNRLRQTRMVFALTHTFISLALAVGLTITLGFTLRALLLNEVALVEIPGSGAGAQVAARLVGLVLPYLGVFVAVAFAALLLLTPLVGTVSYRLAKRFTRRLENLAAAIRALEVGEPRPNLAVSGEDEIAQLQSSFNHMAERLEQRENELKTQRDQIAGLLASRRELFASVSHELRTPVAVLTAYLDSNLQRWQDGPPETLRRDMQFMRSDLTRMQGLLDDLFTLARSEVDQLRLVCRPLRVGPLLKEVYASFSPLAWQENRVGIALDMANDLPPIYADEVRLAQVIANLLRNAVRHSRPGGVIALQAREIEGTVQISVLDDGEGIPAEDLPRIWERYYQAEGSRAGQAGIGLALVKELVEAMQGRVSVESSPESGTCFCIHFPALPQI